MIEEAQARARLIAHYANVIDRLQQRIDTLRQDVIDLNCDDVSVGTITRYKAEIVVHRRKLAYLRDLLPRAITRPTGPTPVY